MNKKGADLVKEVGGTLIVVIGLVIIAYTAYRYYSVSANQEDTNAQHLIDSIVGKIDALGDGQNNTFVFSGFSGGNSWFLYAFNKNEIGPDKCYFRNCICICKGGSSSISTSGDSETFLTKVNGEDKDILVVEAQKIADACQAKSFCRFFDRKIDFFMPIKTSPVEGGGVDAYPNFYVREKLFEVNITKTKEDIELSPEFPE